MTKHSCSPIFGDLSNAHLMELLGEDPSEVDQLTPEEVHERRYELFRNELAEIFLGGFMHDCGLWIKDGALQLPERS